MKLKISQNKGMLTPTHGYKNRRKWKSYAKVVEFRKQNSCNTCPIVHHTRRTFWRLRSVKIQVMWHTVCRKRGSSQMKPRAQPARCDARRAPQKLAINSKLWMFSSHTSIQPSLSLKFCAPTSQVILKFHLPDSTLQKWFTLQGWVHSPTFTIFKPLKGNTCQTTANFIIFSNRTISVI